MLVTLSAAARTLIAADEFQCLDQALRPNPLVTWLQEDWEPETLAQIRRTNIAGLLAAAAIRDGQAPVNGHGFRILQPGVSIPLAATLLANAIASRQGGGNVAIITPAPQGDLRKKWWRVSERDPAASMAMGRTRFTGKVRIAARSKRFSQQWKCRTLAPDQRWPEFFDGCFGRDQCARQSPK